MAYYTPMPMVKGPRGARLEPITVEWHRCEKSLVLPTNYSQIVINVDGMGVDEARNQAVQLALKNDPVPEFLFSLDYDVLPAHDAILKLAYRAKCYPDHDIFAGVYCCKSIPSEPLIYQDFGQGAFWDWTVGDVLTTDSHGIKGVHMGLTLIRMSLFNRLEHTADKPWFLTREKEAKQIEGGGIQYVSGTEDLWFCKRALEEADAKILVDTSVLAGHINHQTGQIFGLPNDSPPVVRCPYMGDTNGKPKKTAKRCLDIGAGETKREWEGYKTSTLDIRADVEPDFVQDTRLLNFPDNHWDMVASSHHLEHIGRWDQEKVWKEMFRILKPGGRMEHIVPNLEWAAWKITDGQTDQHAYDVLYGAQEVHGYQRELNTHFFGYTVEVAQELAKMCGLTDVVVETFKQREELGYNMVITGTKPKQKKAAKKAPRKAAKKAVPKGVEKVAAKAAKKKVVQKAESKKP
jgi:predicted SAM-dependent methyltransferase